MLRHRQPAHPGRLRHRGDGRPLLHRAAVRGGADAQAVHGRPAAGDAVRPLARDPDRRRPRRGPRERDRPPRPQARQHHRRARRPGEGPRLRPRQDARSGRRGGRHPDAFEDRRSPDRDRRALRLDGLQLPGAGVGPARRPPHRRVQPRCRALRDGHRCRPVSRPPRGRGAERGHQRDGAPDRRPQPPGPPRPPADPRPGDGEGPARPLPDDGRVPRRAQGAHAAPDARDGPRAHGGDGDPPRAAARPRRLVAVRHPRPRAGPAATLGPGPGAAILPDARERALSPPQLGQREAAHPRGPPLPQPRRQPGRRLLRVLPGGRRHHRARQRQVARGAPLGLRGAVRGPDRRSPEGRRGAGGEPRPVRRLHKDAREDARHRAAPRRRHRPHPLERQDRPALPRPPRRAGRDRRAPPGRAQAPPHRGGAGADRPAAHAQLRGLRVLPARPRRPVPVPPAHPPRGRPRPGGQDDARGDRPRSRVRARPRDPGPLLRAVRAGLGRGRELRPGRALLAPRPRHRPHHRERAAADGLRGHAPRGQGQGPRPRGGAAEGGAGRPFRPLRRRGGPPPGRAVRAGPRTCTTTSSR